MKQKCQKLSFKYFYVFIFIVLGLVQARANEKNEYIKHFDVSIEIDTQGVFHISETIEVYAAGIDVKRGIYRSLPLSRRDIDNNFIPVEYSIGRILLNGVPTTYHTKKEGAFKTIYIGDKDIFLEPGYYTYVIEYQTYGQVGFFDNYDEIYWNITGNDWLFNISDVRASITVPPGTKVLKNRCFTGEKFSKVSKCTSTNESDRTVIFKTKTLLPKEGLTIGTEFTNGIISRPPPPGFFKKYLEWIIGSISLLVLCIYYLITWFRFGQDPPKPAVYPIFEPPKGISPGKMAKLRKTTPISASLVNLAVNGHIRIEEEVKGNAIFKDRNYTLHRTSSNSVNTSSEEKVLLRELVGSGSTEITGKYNKKIERAHKKYNDRLKKDFDQMFHVDRNHKYIIFPSLIIILTFLSFYFHGIGFDNWKSNLESVFILLLMIGTIAFPFISVFRHIKLPHFIFFIFILLVFFQVNFMSIFSNQYISPGVYSIFGIASVVSLLIYGYLIQKPSQQRVDLKAQIEGFEMYLTMAESKQIQHFNPPQMTPEIFEKLLPYAIALKVDDIWGETFEDYLKMAGINNYKSDWYTGATSFNADFPRTINRGLNNNTTSATYKPQSSTGSGSWSSSSGGFSGGGGGGGGGGGW